MCNANPLYTLAPAPPRRPPRALRRGIPISSPAPHDGKHACTRFPTQAKQGGHALLEPPSAKGLVPETAPADPTRRTDTRSNVCEATNQPPSGTDSQTVRVCKGRACTRGGGGGGWRVRSSCLGGEAADVCAPAEQATRGRGAFFLEAKGRKGERLRTTFFFFFFLILPRISKKKA